MNISGVQYRKAETSSVVWLYVVDQEAMQHQRDRESVREDLWWALRSRVLTDEEMSEVRRYGQSLNTPSNVCYNAHQKALELNAALAMQAELRILALRGKP